MTGKPPRDWKSPSSIGELVAAVCDTPVPLPSTRDPQLTPHLAGDLDAIVVKATQIDPDLRYESVDALAHDLHAGSMDFRSEPGSRPSPIARASCCAAAGNRSPL
jgi:serine/threonine protein kinase